jgi:predicted deacylase
MAIIDVTVEIRGESKATTSAGLRINATANLTGFAASGLVRPNVPSQSDPSKSGA